MSSTVQIVTIVELDQLNQLGNNDFLIVYDSTSLTWKKIPKSNIQLDMAVHNNSSHSTPFLISSSNLSDLTNVSQAIINLGLQNTLNKTENLADLTNVSAAIINLGLQNTLNKIENLADLTNVSEARINLNLTDTHIRVQGNYIIVDTNTILQVGKKYIIKENVIIFLPTNPNIGNEIEIICGEPFGSTDVLDSFINPNGKNIEGNSSIVIMSELSFRLVYTGTSYGWSRI